MVEDTHTHTHNTEAKMKVEAFKVDPTWFSKCVPRPASSAAPGNVLEIQILRLLLQTY